MRIRSLAHGNSDARRLGAASSSPCNGHDVRFALRIITSDDPNGRRLSECLGTKRFFHNSLPVIVYVLSKSITAEDAENAEEILNLQFPAACCGEVHLLYIWLFPRDKEPHYSPYDRYSQDNACGYCKAYSKKKSQLEDQIKKKE
jgi:hypothetical protein